MGPNLSNGDPRRRNRWIGGDRPGEWPDLAFLGGTIFPQCSPDATISLEQSDSGRFNLDVGAEEIGEPIRQQVDWAAAVSRKIPGRPGGKRAWLRL